MGGRAGSVTFVALAALLVGVPPASAATITVTTRADEVANDGFCSLREAVTAANSGMHSGAAAGECPAGDAAANTILLAGGAPYVLTAAAGGSLHITSALTISGAGAASTTIDAGGVARVLDVGAVPAASITAVTISGGRAPDTNAGVPAGSGGGIRNAGVLTLTDTKVVGNQAGTGRGGSDPFGTGGAGGGVYNSGMLTLLRSTVADNIAGKGGQGGGPVSNPPPVPDSGPGAGGQGGPGGGVFNADGATLNMSDSSITGNHAGAGGGGGAGGITDHSSFPGAIGGVGGAGGGLWNAGTLSLTRSVITGNAAGRGGNGGGGGGPGASGGLGGGVFDNSAVSQTIANSTIAANGAGAGGDGTGGGYGGDGGGGGGLVSANAALGLVNVTVSANQVGSGGGDGGGGGGPGGIGGGGGISAFGSATIQNTIVAGNSGGNCLGAVTDGGHNLSFPDTTCPGVNGDPKLGMLQDNGGPTQTMALEAGSTAIDKVPASGAGCPAKDQRGVPRPQPAGGLCDIGAYEFVLPSCRPVAATTVVSLPVAVHLSCTDLTGARLSYAIDANPTHGSLSSLDPATGKVTYAPRTGYRGADSFTYHATSANGTAATKSVTITVTALAPIVSGENISPSALVPERGSGPSATASRKRGARVTFKLSEAATVRFTIRRKTSGRTVGRSCVKRTRSNRKRKKCSRLVVVGTFTAAGVAGSNSFHFTGRANRMPLQAGNYLLTAVATDAAGKRSKPASRPFRIVK
jgi:CSLREA domain-containing protein